MTDFETQIERIMEKFDFRSVHECMALLNWEWYREGWDLAVPSIERLREKARELLVSLSQSTDTTCVESGGFSVRFLSGRTLLLQFVIEDMAGRSWTDMEVLEEGSSKDS